MHAYIKAICATQRNIIIPHTCTLFITAQVRTRKLSAGFIQSPAGCRRTPQLPLTVRSPGSSQTKTTVPLRPSSAGSVCGPGCFCGRCDSRLSAAVSVLGTAGASSLSLRSPASSRSLLSATLRQPRRHQRQRHVKLAQRQPAPLRPAAAVTFKVKASLKNTHK